MLAQLAYNHFQWEVPALCLKPLLLQDCVRGNHNVTAKLLMDKGGKIFESGKVTSLTFGTPHFNACPSPFSVMQS